MFYNGNSGLSENSGLEMGMDVGEAEGSRTAQELGPSRGEEGTALRQLCLASS